MKKIFIFLILFFLGLTLFPARSLALTISPGKFVLSADPGQTIETSMYVRNDADKTLTLYPTIERYTTRGGEEPVYYPENYGLPTWIETVPSEVTLAGGGSANVSIKINVPEDAEPGGHYAVIFWSSAKPQQKGGGVGIVTRVGALVLLSVSGDVVEGAELVSFKADKKVLNYLPAGFSYGFKNTGNVHLRPTGKLTIKNIFGKTVAILDANPGSGYTLPQTTRTYSTANWEPKAGIPKIEGEGFFANLKKEKAGFAVGYYKAYLNLEFGDQIKTAKVSFGFWVLPWRILISSALALGILLLFFTKGIKKYNQWVISRANRTRI